MAKDKKKTADSMAGDGIMGFVIAGIMKKLKPLILRAKPKLLAYLAGLDEETGENTGERIITIFLVNKFDENGKTNKKDAIVQIAKKENTKVLYKPGTQPEQQHSVEDWVEKLVKGDFKTEKES